MKYDAIVIGAGPNGLTAAATLAKRGKRVVVLESADAVGGHRRTIEFAPGFRSPLSDDAGWLPPNVEAELGVGIKQGSGGAVTVVDGNGVQLHLPGRPFLLATFAGDHEIVGRLSKRDGKRWFQLFERLRRFAGVLEALYQRPPVDIDTTSLGDLVGMARIGLKVRRLGRADMTEFLRVMPMSVQDLLDDTFETELVKAMVASLAVRDLRQGPRSGGTALNLVHHLVGAGHFARRVDYFADGPDAFARAAASVATQRGVTVRTGTRVNRIAVRNDTIAGVVLATGEEVAAPIVISTADPKRTLLDLIDPIHLDPETAHTVSNIRLRGCTAFIMYALDALEPPTLTAAGFEKAARLGTDAPVSLTSDTAMLERAADAAKYGEVSAEPHIEFFVPTSRWPDLAPQGKHILTARVQYAPYALKSGAWTTKDASALEKKVTAAIARVIPNFASTVKHSRVLTPRDIEAEFGVTEGALTQGEVMLDQILFMRPIPGWSRHAMPIRGLFLGGSGAHPGPGILGGAGLLAAKAAL